MKKESWLGNALIGLLLTAAVLGSYFLPRSFIESLELKTYDMRAQLRGNIDPSPEIVIVDIDEDSIVRLGRWPWPRTRIAEILKVLREAGPRVIGLDILYTEPERNPALDELKTLKSDFIDLVSNRKLFQRKGTHFEGEFDDAAERLDTDKHLRAALEETPNVVLPMFFQEINATAGGTPPALPEAVVSNTLSVRLTSDVDLTLFPPVQAGRASYPIVPFVQASAGVGHVNIIPDQDGVVRRETPAIKYGDHYYPGYALELVARYLGLKSEDVTVTPGKSVKVGDTVIPLDESQSMLVTFNGDARTFRYYSFYEVLDGKVPADVFKDKIVILGPTAAGVGNLYVTPLSRALPSVEFIANVIENVLHRRFLTRPAWAMQAELGAIAFFGLFIMFMLPRMRALGGATVTTLFLAGLLGAGAYLFKERAEWLKVTYPSVLLLAGYLVIVTKRFFATEKGKEFVEASQVETNKMLGLSFQGQGMLDMAFEKFRLVPLEDDSMKDTLYNLGLDFERKRQYAKAVSVYKHISKKDLKYKDIADKIKTLSAAAEGAVFGGVGQKSAEGTVLVTGGASTPTLGRYEIEKELGRGAMGIVYLGKDPKINRKVAIKTLMLEEGSSPAETKEIRERFFREAESAGTLNHPGIVRIYDAGEDQDVCYIAMELLSGSDLTQFTNKEKMLPLPTALDYIARVAEALEYAHSQGIVHRDIKPANIMLISDGSVRVTDFGIARITASSKTATGTVMGTPSYMSPEQVAGKKVDGRADIFSLGVTLFEFVTGEKPFKGGEGIGTLLFQIANDPEPDPKSVNPKLPDCVKAVIHKALKKKPDERYQKAGVMAQELRACLAAIQGEGAPAEASEAVDTAAQETADSLKIEMPQTAGVGGQPAKPAAEKAPAESSPEPAADDGLKIEMPQAAGVGVSLPEPAAEKAPAEPSPEPAADDGLKIEMPQAAGVGVPLPEPAAEKAPAEPSPEPAADDGLKIEMPQAAGTGAAPEKAPVEPSPASAEVPAEPFPAPAEPAPQEPAPPARESTSPKLTVDEIAGTLNKPGEELRIDLGAGPAAPSSEAAPPPQTEVGFTPEQIADALPQPDPSIEMATKSARETLSMPAEPAPSEPTIDTEPAPAEAPPEPRPAPAAQEAAPVIQEYALPPVESASDETIRIAPPGQAAPAEPTLNIEPAPAEAPPEPQPAQEAAPSAVESPDQGEAPAGSREMNIQIEPQESAQPAAPAQQDPMLPPVEFASDETIRIAPAGQAAPEEPTLNIEPAAPAGGGSDETVLMTPAEMQAVRGGGASAPAEQTAPVSPEAALPEEQTADMTEPIPQGQVPPPAAEKPPESVGLAAENTIRLVDPDKPS